MRIGFPTSISWAVIAWIIACVWTVWSITIIVFPTAFVEISWCASSKILRTAIAARIKPTLRGRIVIRKWHIIRRLHSCCVFRWGCIDLEINETGASRVIHLNNKCRTNHNIITKNKHERVEVIKWMTMVAFWLTSLEFCALIYELLIANEESCRLVRLNVSNS